MGIAGDEERRFPDGAYPAFLIAPPLAILCALILTHAWYFAISATDPSVQLAHFAANLLFFGFGAWILGVLFGLPAYLILRRAGILTPLSIISMATAIAIMIGFALGGWPFEGTATDFTSYFAEGCQIILDNARTQCGREILMRDSATVYLAGPIGGLAFWLIYSGEWRMRPPGS